MTDYVTVGEARSWVAEPDYADTERLARTLVHQAELLAEAREALQEIRLLTEDPETDKRVWLAACAVLARLDSQEEQ